MEIQWVTYDGTEGTLPEYYRSVLLASQNCAALIVVPEDDGDLDAGGILKWDLSPWQDDGAFLSDLAIGDRWAYFPALREAAP